MTNKQKTYHKRRRAAALPRWKAIYLAKCKGMKFREISEVFGIDTGQAARIIENYREHLLTLK